MDSKAKIYIAGHAGLVGSALFRTLRQKGYTRLVIRRRAELDLTDQAAVRAFFAAERPDFVFLAAARVGGILANDTYKADFIYQNLMIAANVIRAAFESGVKKLLNLGSSCIYPKLAPQPMTEDALLTGPLEPTNEPYAVAKIAAIKLCRYFNEQYGTDFLSVMPTNLYGPGDNYHLRDSHVMAALIRKFHLGRLWQAGDLEGIRKDVRRWEDPEGIDRWSEGGLADFLAANLIRQDGVGIWGTGTPRREFLYVDDLAEACVFLMEGYSSSEIGEFVNIGTGRDIPIKQLAEKVRQAVGYEGEIFEDRIKPDGTPRKLLDTGRLERLGWRPRVGLTEGIAKAYAAYREAAVS